MDGRMGVIGVLDHATGVARMKVTSGDPVLLEPLMTCRAADIPFLTAVPDFELDTPYTVLAIYNAPGSDIRERWLASPLVQSWAIPNQLDDFFWLAMMKQADRSGAFVIMTDRGRRPIDDDDLKLMEAFAPHIRRAVTIGDLFESERATAAVFRLLVEALAHPVLIVAADMRVIFANAAAEALIRDGRQDGRLGPTRA